jgi:myo-inositol-1(or 4)-monophosphatase
MSRPDGDFRREVHVAADAVATGLEIAGRGIGSSDVRFKGERDVVTAADVAVEDEIRSIVGDALSFPVIGEERGGDPPADSPYWLLDPICGTRNYASGIPLYCVNLALVEGGRVVVSAVGDASTGEVLIAERGRGARIRDDGPRRSLAVSGDGQTIIVEEGRSHGDRREHAARFAAAAITADRWDVLSLDTTLSLAYVAVGRVAAYVVHTATPLHVAAATLLVTEAGGELSDIDGGAWTLGSDSLVASCDAALHRELLTLLRTV